MPLPNGWVEITVARVWQKEGSNSAATMHMGGMVGERSRPVMVKRSVLLGRCWPRRSDRLGCLAGWAVQAAQLLPVTLRRARQYPTLNLLSPRVYQVQTPCETSGSRLDSSIVSC